MALTFSQWVDHLTSILLNKNIFSEICCSATFCVTSIYAAWHIDLSPVSSALSASVSTLHFQTVAWQIKFKYGMLM